MNTNDDGEMPGTRIRVHADRWWQNMQELRQLSPDMLSRIATQREQSFRAGYRYGYRAAIDRLHDLIFQEGFDIHAAYLRLVEFHEHELLQWARDKENCQQASERTMYPTGKFAPELPYQPPVRRDDESEW